MRAAAFGAFLLVLGCAARETAPLPGLVARLDVEPSPEGVTVILHLRNASTAPLPIVAVEEWDEITPDLIHEGIDAEASLHVERLSGSTPKGFALLAGPLHSSPRQRRLTVLRPGEFRSFPKALLLPPGEYEARAIYLGMAREDVDAEPLTTEPLRFRVGGPIRLRP